MIYINIIKFVLVSWLEKDYNMLEVPCLKNVIFIQTVSSFAPSRQITNICNDFAQKYGIVTVKDFWKYEKLKYKRIN